MNIAQTGPSKCGHAVNDRGQNWGQVVSRLARVAVAENPTPPVDRRADPSGPHGKPQLTWINDAEPAGG